MGGFIGAGTALLIERYKSRLDKGTMSYGIQLEIYRDVWHSIYMLKMEGDTLWNSANRDNLTRFVEALRCTEDTVYKNLILINHEHENEFNRIINIYWGFQFGKQKLIDMREGISERCKTNNPDVEFVSFGDIASHDIEFVLEQNRQYKEQYEQLTVKIKNSFRKHLYVD